jgi:hypothetical protein
MGSSYIIEEPDASKPVRSWAGSIINMFGFDLRQGQDWIDIDGDLNASCIR